MHLIMPRPVYEDMNEVEIHTHFSSTMKCFMKGILTQKHVGTASSTLTCDISERKKVPTVWYFWFGMLMLISCLISVQVWWQMFCSVWVPQEKGTQWGACVQVDMHVELLPPLTGNNGKEEGRHQFHLTALGFHDNMVPQHGGQALHNENSRKILWRR